MRLLSDNRSLIQDQEKTYLTATVASAGVTLTVQAVDTNAWADNDYVIVGELGAKNAELLQANGAVTDGTSLVVDQLGSGGARYAHSVGEPVYRIAYNRVEFSRSATDDSGAGAVLATNEIQPDDLYTRYEDTTNTTGFGFVRWNNQATSAFSSYSDGVPYTGYEPRTLFRMRKKVRRLLNEVITAEDIFIEDSDIDEELNNGALKVAQDRLWPFFSRTRSLSGVANQDRYALDSAVSKLFNASYDTQPLAIIDRVRLDHLNWDSSVTGDPDRLLVWRDEDSNSVFVRAWPRPRSAAGTTTLGAAISSTTVTTVTVVSSADLQESGRVIIDSEVIEYDATTTTTLTGCRRGAEGTTAATHSNGATVTERDIVYHFNQIPTRLVDTNDTTPIPNPDVLAYYAARELCPQKKELGFYDRFDAKFKEEFAALKANFGNTQTGGPRRVKDRSEITSDHSVLRDPNRSPQSLTGQA